MTPSPLRASASHSRESSASKNNASQSSDGTTSSSDKTKKVQGQIDEVIVIMHDNIEKAVSRGEKLETLKNKTEDLKEGAINFKKNSKSMQSAM